MAIQPSDSKDNFNEITIIYYLSFIIAMPS